MREQAGGNMLDKQMSVNNKLQQQIATLPEWQNKKRSDRRNAGEMCENWITQTCTKNMYSTEICKTALQLNIRLNKKGWGSLGRLF